MLDFKVALITGAFTASIAGLGVFAVPKALIQSNPQPSAMIAGEATSEQLVIPSPVPSPKPSPVPLKPSPKPSPSPSPSPTPTPSPTPKPLPTDWRKIDEGALSDMGYDTGCLQKEKPPEECIRH